MGGALLVVFAVRELEMSPAALGLAFSLGNVGPLLAAFTTSRISGRIGVGPTILSTSVLFCTSLLFLPLASKDAAVPFLVASGVLGGFGAIAYSITQLSFRAIGALFGFLPILFSPVRKLREMPEPVDEALPSEPDAAGGLLPAAAGALPPAAD